MKTSLKWGPVTDEEVAYVAEKLQKMYSGMKEYKTSYDVRNDKGEELNGRTDFRADGKYEIVIDSEVEKDPRKRIETYVHEIVHGMRGIKDSDDMEDVVENKTGKIILRLYNHEDSKVREMAYDGYQAHLKRRGSYFTRNDSGITDAELEEMFNQYYVVGSAGQPSSGNIPPKMWAQMLRQLKKGRVPRKIKYRGKDYDPEVIGHMVYNLIGVGYTYSIMDEEELGAALEYKKWEMEETKDLFTENIVNDYHNKREAVAKKYGAQANEIKESKYELNKSKELAMQAGASVAGAAEGLVRTVVKTPLNIIDTFLGNYSGGVINPNTSGMISKEPNITKGMFELGKYKDQKSFNQKKTRSMSKLQRQMGEELAALDTEYKKKETIYKNTMNAMERERSEIAQALAEQI